MGRHRLLALVFISLLAAVPRFYGLGAPGFMGDEELTAFASRSMNELGRPQMPSGMQYLRALPFTLANSTVLRFSDKDEEASYRLVAAAFGTCTIPLIVVAATPVFGWSAAFSGALLMAVSKRHIGTSRTARMYAPFLFFFLLATFSAWNWGRFGRKPLFLTALLSALVAVTLQKLAFLLAFSAFLPMLLGRSFFPKASTKSVLFLVLALAGAVVGYEALSEFVAGLAASRPELDVTLPGTTVRLQGVVHRISDGIDGVLLGLLGPLVGGLIGWRLASAGGSEGKPPTSGWELLWYYSTAILSGILAGMGLLYGSAVFLVLFLVPQRSTAGQVLGGAREPFILLCGLCLLTLVFRIGPELDLGGVKEAFFFPFPNALYFAQDNPAISFLFAISGFVLVLRPEPRDVGVRVGVIGVVIQFLILGILTEWTPFRYLLGTYPLALLCGAWGGLWIIRKILQSVGIVSARHSLLVMTLIAVSGVLGGSGFPQALHGMLSLEDGAEWNPAGSGGEWVRVPDHENAGKFVRARLRTTDEVVAEDATMQVWYVGRVDYWLRNPRNHARYTYVDKEGRRRDLYTDARIVGIDDLGKICDGTSRRVWVITSAETSGMWRHYLDEGQQTWLEDLMSRQEPLFEAEDDVTRVYLLECETRDPPLPSD